MTSDNDLWPEDLVTEIPRTPKDILLEQAAALGKKTRNVVQAKVRSYQDEDGDLAHRFVLHAPALGDYEYELFGLWHDEALYPVNVAGQKVADEPAFREFLRSFFASERTLRIVRAMIANSRAEAGTTKEIDKEEPPF